MTRAALISVSNMIPCVGNPQSDSKRSSHAARDRLLAGSVPFGAFGDGGLVGGVNRDDATVGPSKKTRPVQVGHVLTDRRLRDAHHGSKVPHAHTAVGRYELEDHPAPFLAEDRAVIVLSWCRLGFDGYGSGSFAFH
jgi:hypothetical protein